MGKASSVSAAYKATGTAPTVYQPGPELDIGVDETTMDKLMRGAQTWLFVTDDLVERFNESSVDTVSLRVRAPSGGIAGNSIRMTVRDVLGKDEIPHLATGCSMMVFHTHRLISIERITGYFKKKQTLMRAWAELQKMMSEGEGEEPTSAGYNAALGSWMQAEKDEQRALTEAFDAVQSYEKGAL